MQDAGIYGYDAPTKQKLTVAEGTGTITFTVQSPGFNNGTESSGDTAPTEAAFVSGSTEQKDLAFSITPPPSTSSGGGGGGSSSNSGSPSSGGGGGGGGGGSILPVTPSTSSPATSTPITISTSTVSAPPKGQVLGASAYMFTRFLRRGVSGDDVIQLQKILIAQGHLRSTASGYFGALTESALKAFQKAHGIDQTGSTGSKTRQALNSISAPTMSDSDKQALIQKLQAQVQALLAEIASLNAQTATSSH